MYSVSLDGDFVSRWIMQRLGGPWSPGLYAGIGLARDGELVAAAAFEGYNGWNVLVHLVIDDQQATMLLFKLVGRYAFGQLGLKRLTLIAESSNIRAIQLHERLGAVREGCLVGAGRGGDDILLSRLTAECRLWRRWNGQKQQSTRGPELRATDPPSGTVEHQSVQHDAGRIAGELTDALRHADVV